jgi:DNA-binding transcriptional LysR family regulator
MNRPLSLDAISWDSISAFLAVMRTGSLSAAARSLRLTQPTVRGHIDALERALDRVLFNRSHAGLAPTAAALEALGYAETMAANADALVRAVSGADRSAEAGAVRVTCSEIVGLEVLPPILARLKRAYPGLEIELAPTDRNENLVRRDADVAVRMARPTQNALVARHVGDVEIGLFAAEAYLNDHALPRQTADLTVGQSLIGDDRLDLLVMALKMKGIDMSRQDFAMRTDSGPAQLAAIRAGFGIGACQVPLARRGAEPLRRILPQLSLALPIWIVMHEDLRPIRRIRLVFDFLAQAMARYARDPAMAENDELRGR